MKITPLDIRQKTFEKNFRGYDKDEVSTFLSYLSQEWEKLVEEKNALEIKYEHAEKEASKLREVEQSLFKTLKTAEDTGASIIEQANKTAELILKEAQMNADALHAESRGKARNMIDQAESQSKNIIEDLKEDVNVLVENYEKLLDQRDYLLKNLKRTASETLENVKTAQDGFTEIDTGIHTRLVKELQRKEKSYEVPEQEESKPSLSANTYTWEQPKNQDLAEQNKINEAKEEKEEGALEIDTISEQEKAEGDEKADKINSPTDKGGKKDQNGSFFDQFE
ncbi:DivIVA domain-containing protein [Cyclobacterium marinum]|uniref:DivIVA domain-containing protein n=1 Tax=Cyclobacterium marinum TaxID=104 RepID=UPI0011EFAD33|nr:DivIVA domain-containing protein [Cyclobacterium marinum]MBI0399728.1 DivIVA domain-containing protein [Cyclobacterium marinum]